MENIQHIERAGFFSHAKPLPLFRLGYVGECVNITLIRMSLNLLKASALRKEKSARSCNSVFKK